MTEDEKAFLAQIALGWFTVQEDGTIWRHVKFTGGGTSALERIPVIRAEKSLSKKNGYLRILFHDNGRRRRVAAHRIVWMIFNKDFIPYPLQINHLNGIKSDNHPLNLERVTQKMNIQHAFQNLPRKKKAQYGEKNAGAKVNKEQVLQIKNLWENKAMSQRKIGEIYGITQSAVSAIVRGKSWVEFLG